jgi:hypothetical protein
MNLGKAVLFTVSQIERFAVMNLLQVVYSNLDF